MSVPLLEENNKYLTEQSSSERCYTYMLTKLFEQDIELSKLHTRLLQTRHEKEKLQADFEHALTQLKNLQQVAIYGTIADLAYL